MTKGVALITVLIVASLLAFLGIGFVSIMVAESKISQTQMLASQAHYLAEAGVQRAIWQLNNDAQWKKDFKDGDLLAELKLTNEFYPGDEIKIEIKSLSPGKAEIESKARYKGAERKIILEVFKPLGGITEPSELRAVFAGLNISFNNARDVKINQGSIHANNALDVRNSSNVVIEQIASASKIDVDGTSTLKYGEKIEPVNPITAPALDFNDYKQKADFIYTVDEFASLLAANPTLSLSGIIYVTGSESCVVGIERKEPKQTLTINGFLLTDCAVHLADKGGFGYTDLIIRNIPGQPSGLASRNSIIIKNWASLDVQGLIYASKGINRGGDFFSDINVLGGVISASPDHDLYIISEPNELTITYNENIIKTTLGQPEDSPLITINHWEEEY